MIGKKPLVTLGLPVYNGAEFLSRCLDSLLAQTCQDFELIIADNGSTDDTPRVAVDYARRDQRIRYVRHERNLGFSHNMNFLFRSAQGRYILCTGAKDWRTPDCLARYLEIMEADPEIALCYGQTVGVDEHGAEHEVETDDLETRGLKATDRFRKVIRRMKRGDLNYGLLRVETLRRTRLFRNVYGHDHVLMAELSLQGTFAHLRVPVFFRRERRHPASSRETVRQLLTMIDPQIGTAHRWFPFWMFLWEHIRGLWSASMSCLTKIGLTLAALRILRRRFWWGMKKDVRELFIR